MAVTVECFLVDLFLSFWFSYSLLSFFRWGNLVSRNQTPQIFMTVDKNLIWRQNPLGVHRDMFDSTRATKAHFLSFFSCRLFLNKIRLGKL